MQCYTTDRHGSVPVFALTPERLPVYLASQSHFCQQWVKAQNFQAKPGDIAMIADPDGQLAAVLLGVDGPDDFWAFGALPGKLPPCHYWVENTDAYFTVDQLDRVSMAWALGSYRYSRYRTVDPFNTALVVSDEQLSRLTPAIESIVLTRDLINTPADDLGPNALAEQVSLIAKKMGAHVTVIKGEALQAAGYAGIYTVGRAAVEPPQYIDLQYGEVHWPRVTLVGKGVCFDTGGLDLKNAAGMRSMKKDMGGAAHALALAQWIMAAGLRIRLRLMIAAVENAVGSASYHPGDVIQTRAGISVEVDNTDAEGRLVMCELLDEAARENPDYLINFATLTGAARVALGTQMPALFCNDDAMADALLASSRRVLDPIWRMPLYQPYDAWLKSDIADVANCATHGYGGAITAALFLQRFVPKATRWAHFDMMAANHESLPGRPKGGEAQGLRAVFDFLQQQYA